MLLACLLLVCLVLPVSAADAPALFGTANAADGTVTVTLSLRGGSAGSADRRQPMDRPVPGRIVRHVDFPAMEEAVQCDCAGRHGDMDHRHAGDSRS